MVNTRKGGGIDLPANPHNRRVIRQQQAEMNPLNPPPAGTDPLVVAQMQMLQQRANTMTDMQAQIRQERQEMRQERLEMREEMRQERMVRQQQAPMPPSPPPVPPQDKHQEFMSHKPPTFSSSPDPLHADDWLKSVEKILNIAQCSDREKVIYASGRLTGPTTDCWDSYIAAHDAANNITKAEFTTQFRNYHIPARLMKIKKEFLSLKQRNVSVSEYRDKFIQLSRYALDDSFPKQTRTTICNSCSPDFTTEFFFATSCITACFAYIYLINSRYSSSHSQKMHLEPCFCQETNKTQIRPEGDIKPTKDLKSV
jgi:hypothetical protein